MNSNRSLIEGSIFKNLLSFALPFLFSNMIQCLYGAVDMAIVGWGSDSAGISAVSIGAQIIQIVFCLVVGLNMGGTILIAQYLGAKKERDIVETIGTMLSLFAIASVILTVVMFFVTTPILNLMQTPKEAFDQAKAYVLISSGGIVFIFGYNAVSAILRGFGDSTRPLVFISIACVTNIILDLLFVCVFHMGAAGAAIATVIAQALSMVLAFLYLNRKKFIFQFKLANFRIHRDKVIALFKVGLPVSLQETCVSFSFLFITSIINSMGVVASAAVGIAGKFENFAMLPSSAFSGAISAIAAQNIGANQPERAKKSLYWSVGIAVCFSLLFFAWAQIMPSTILSIFKADSAVTLAGAEYLRSFSFDFILVAFGFSLNGFFNGCGKTTFSMINGVFASVLIRIPLAYVLSVTQPTNLFGIGFAAPAATLASNIVGIIYFIMGRWKVSKIVSQPASQLQEPGM